MQDSGIKTSDNTPELKNQFNLMKNIIGTHNQALCYAFQLRLDKTPRQVPKLT